MWIAALKLIKKDTRNVEQVFEMAAVFPDNSCESTAIYCGGYKNTKDFKQICLRNLFKNTKMVKRSNPH